MEEGVMSDTRKHQKKWGNKRRGVALLKAKDRRRLKRAGRAALATSEPPGATMRKFVIDAR